MELLEVGFFPRAHTAIAEWLACMIYILPQTKRLGGRSWRQVVLYIGFFALLWLMNTLNEGTTGLVWIVLMIACMLSMLLMIWTTCKVTLMEAAYIWAHAFMAAEFAASLEWQINYYLLVGGHVGFIGIWCVMLLVYAVVFGLLVLLCRRTNALHSRRSISGKELVSVLSITMGAFFLSNFSFAFTDNLFSELQGTGILYSRTLVDFGGLVMIFAHDESRAEINLSLELEVMEGLLNRQYEQYRQFDINNKTMHRVYHDLKHQIAFIRAEPNERIRDTYLAEMDRAVSMREADVNTGSAVLDTFLTSKSMVCVEHGIVMSCFADAQDLGFMDVMDICSIFGNAIDNAIECVQQLEDRDKRLIKVSVYTQNRFLLIRIENYCETTVDFSGGLPTTTKANRDLHGYGIKSIQRAAEKYHGCVTLEQQDGWFGITVLLPLHEAGN